jgi:hypothetical protein
MVQLQYLLERILGDLLKRLLDIDGWAGELYVSYTIRLANACWR